MLGIEQFFISDLTSNTHCLGSTRNRYWCDANQYMPKDFVWLASVWPLLVLHRGETRAKRLPGRFSPRFSLAISSAAAKITGHWVAIGEAQSLSPPLLSKFQRIEKVGEIRIVFLRFPSRYNGSPRWHLSRASIPGLQHGLVPLSSGSRALKVEQHNSCRTNTDLRVEESASE